MATCRTISLFLLVEVERGRDTRPQWCKARPDRACDDDENGNGGGSGASVGCTFNETERVCRKGAIGEVQLPIGSGNGERVIHDDEELCLVKGVLLSTLLCDGGGGCDNVFVCN